MLYILRHGQTDWNVNHKLQGRTDIPLNDNGREMAKEAREKYKDVKFDVCYCSPLIRAKETAEIFLEGREIEIIEDKRLREMSFGEYEGLENSIDNNIEPVSTLFKRPLEYVADGGTETLEELYKRTGDFLKKVAYPLLKEGKNVLIVGHGAMNLSIINRLLGVYVGDFWKRLPKNCELMAIDYRPELKIKSVIFDMDGTVTDTEKYYRKAWPEAAKHFGYNMTDEQALAVRSLGKPFARQQFEEWFGKDFDYVKVRDYRRELIEKMIEKDGIPIKEGAIEIFEYLRKRNIKVAMATANEYERAERYLKKIGLFQYFDQIICANMVSEGKPSPAIYEYAAKQLGLDPMECLAVEDSPNGVRSAAAAGCRVALVPDQTEPGIEETGLTLMTVPTLSQLKGLIEEINGK